MNGGRAPRVTRTEAVVLRHRRLGETDRIVTLLTPGRGKLDAVAKGALRPRSKLAGHLEPAMHVEVMLAHGRTLDIVTQAQAIESFPELRHDLERLSTAMYLIDVTDRLTVEHADARPIYDLLLASLVRLARGDGAHLLTRSFEMTLLDIAGFRPEWHVCVECGRSVDAEPIGWSALGGGVVCGVCLAKNAEASLLDVIVLKVLRAIQQGPYEEAARVRLTPELAASLERVMHALIRATAERDLGSQRFVEAVRMATARGLRVEVPGAIESS
jgi:DNA repair protein RecO (recombination protein O)